jgi:signal transduction histidine kinase
VAEAKQPAWDPLAAVQMVAVADEMASLLRHELRNKFAAVRNAGFYIRRRLHGTDTWQADPRLDELSGIIQDEMRLANELLDQRLRLQHVFVAAPSRVDAAECVRLAATCARIASPCSVAIEIDARAGHVMADLHELALAVRCLLENAVEATGESGAVHVRALPVGPRYVIEIMDRGVGIQKSPREAVLEPFYTTKPGHAGLGLNIAQRIAERYEGSLLLRERSKGTAISLELRLSVANASSPEAET